LFCAPGAGLFTALAFALTAEPVVILTASRAAAFTAHSAVILAAGSASAFSAHPAVILAAGRTLVIAALTFGITLAFLAAISVLTCRFGWLAF
jgi:hypothetical protein